MKVLVKYMSITGNTEKIARAIYDEIPLDKEIKKWDEPDGQEEYDLTFVGFPVHKFGPDESQKGFLEKYTKGKKVALFITHAMPPEAPMNQNQLTSCKSAVPGAEVVGVFNCQGELSEQVANMLKQMDSPQMQKFGELRHVTLGHPTEAEIEKARAFARDIMNGQS